MSQENHMAWVRQREQTSQPLQRLQLATHEIQTHNVSCVPASPMECKANIPVGSTTGIVSPGGFLDLKMSRTFGSHSEDSVKKIPQLVLQCASGEGEFNSLAQKGSHGLNLSQLKDVLPAPTITDVSKLSVGERPARPFKLEGVTPKAVAQKIVPPNTVTLGNRSKTFFDGPSLPALEDDEDWLKLPKKSSLPAEDYIEGKVKHTTTLALKKMVEDLAELKLGTTGCIIDAETCDPLCDQYTPEIHFVTDEKFGKGSFGVVDRCYDTQTRKAFARKTLMKGTLRSSEIIVPLTLNHRNVTKVLGLVLREDIRQKGNPTTELLLEYGGESLNRYMTLGQETFSSPQIWDLAKQGLEGLAHMDHYSIVHLDIKPENILVLTLDNGTLVLKITDFGSSRLPQEPPKFVGVTPEYMAPEMCKLFLQSSSFNVNWGLTEGDITGKVDVFAFALVIMYMYKGYHVLVKVINNGKTSYEGVDANSRKILHYQLLMTLADDNNADFVPNLTPDECDLDMRELLHKMTQHKHQHRFCAKDGLTFIEVKEKICSQKRKAESKMKETAGDPELCKQVPLTALPDSYSYGAAGIPGIAEDCMEYENGPIKNRTKDLLRMKISPYGKVASKKAMQAKEEELKSTSAQSSVVEMRRLSYGIASKRLPVGLLPMTPITEFAGLSIGQTAMEEESSVRLESDHSLVQPSLGIEQQSHNKVSQPVQSESRDNCQVDKIISLDRKKSMATRAPGTGTVVLKPGGQPIQIPQELLQQLLNKKLVAQKKVEPEVCPDIIDIRRKKNQAINQSHFHSVGRRASPVPMEEENDRGNIPKFAAFM